MGSDESDERRERARSAWGKRAPSGADACTIGEIREQPACAVLATTQYGGTRIVDMLVGDPLPRIC